LARYIGRSSLPALRKIEIFREKKLYENFLILKKNLNFREFFFLKISQEDGWLAGGGNEKKLQRKHLACTAYGIGFCNLATPYIA